MQSNCSGSSSFMLGLLERTQGKERLLEGRFLDAAGALDPQGRVAAESRARVSERLQGQQRGERQDPLTDVLGAARIYVAAVETGNIQNLDQLEANITHDARTGLIEAIQAEGQNSETELSVNAEGRTHVGGVMIDDLVLRGIHFGWSDILNEYGEIDVYGELLSREHYSNSYFRANYDLVSISLLPDDKVVDDDELLKYGFRPENKKWVIDSTRFKPDVLEWKRVTNRLFLSGSRVDVANEILANAGLTDKPLSSTQIRRKFFLVPKETFASNTSIGLGKMADEIMADKQGGHYFCGKATEFTPTNEDYDNLPHVSKQRENGIEYYAQVLKDVAIHLAKNKLLSDTQQNQAYSNAFIKALQKVCTDNPQYAEHAFGLKAAWLYAEAKRKAEAGDFAGSESDLHGAIDESQSTVICNLTISSDRNSANDASPFASLREKYPNESIIFGKCIACGVHSEVGPCGRGSKLGDGICNPCDTRDRLAPGYVADLMSRKARRQKVHKGFLHIWLGTRLPEAPRQKVTPHVVSFTRKTRKKTR